MISLTLALPYDPSPSFPAMLASLRALPMVDEIIVLSSGGIALDIPRCRVVADPGGLFAGSALEEILSIVRTPYLLLLPRAGIVSFSVDGLNRLIETAESSGAGLTYPDFFEDRGPEPVIYHPLNDYQTGSVRDDFDFGPCLLFSTASAREAIRRWGPLARARFAGLYDLRLKMATDFSLHHVAEPLCTAVPGPAHSGTPDLFAYVDPRNALAQKEMESVFTDHLKRIGAYVPAERLGRIGPHDGVYPVVTSVIIPVLNRKSTISEAIASALSQETDFPFNVIVIDNHSIDGTSAILEDLSRRHPGRVLHLVPVRRDLGIGGCWNEGLHSEACGRFAVQLDSDDLYGGPRTLQTIVDTLREGSYAMVIGSYTLVNERLEQIAPGLVDHREWTDQNGHNNALRINGLGAPRAFDTTLMRTIDFLNVSYGEDYAAALRVCRNFRIGRIFESLYLCRRWSDNTDAALSREAKNKNDAFKDRVRTEEIEARQKMNVSLYVGESR